MKKVTITKLIAEADKLKNKRKETKELYVKSLGGTILIEEPKQSLCLDALDMGPGGDEYLVMECVIEPNLKDKGLMQAYGCKTPLEVIPVLFKPGEIATISKEIVALAGYGGDSVQALDDLKN